MTAKPTNPAGKMPMRWGRRDRSHCGDTRRWDREAEVTPEGWSPGAAPGGDGSGKAAIGVPWSLIGVLTDT